MRRGPRYVVPGVILGALSMHASAAPPAKPACVTLAFSASFARDRTVVCAARSGDAVTLHRSADGGRTWRAVGAAPGAEPRLNPELVLSPRYPGDGTMFVISGGAFRTTDGGRTWARVQETAYSLTPYVETAAAPLAGPRVAVVSPFPAVVGLSAVVDPVLGTRNVAGAVHETLRFLVPPDYATTRTAVALGLDPTTGATVAYECRHDFVCTTPLTTFELGYEDAGALGGAYSNYYVGSDADRYSVYRSPDFGRTWSRWTALEAALRRYRVRPFDSRLGFAVDPADPKRVYVNVRGNWLSTSGDVPAWQLLRSDDGGRSWRRLGWSWAPKQPARAGGTLPWNTVGAGSGGDPWNGTVHAHGGRVYLAAAEQAGGRIAYQGVYCSRDRGVTWRRGC